MSQSTTEVFLDEPVLISSALASIRSDQGLLWAIWVASCGQQIDHSGWMPRLIQIFFWGAQVILLVLSCCGLYESKHFCLKNFCLKWMNTMLNTLKIVV